MQGEQVLSLEREHKVELEALREELARVKGELKDEKLARMTLELEALRAKSAQQQHLLQHGGGDEERAVDRWLLTYSSAAAASISKPPPPLVLAARTERLDVIHHFVKFGVDLNGVDENKDTALHVAVENNLMDVVKCLVQAGARMDIPGGGLVVSGKRLKKSWPPLHLAVAKGNVEMVDTLLAAGADVKAAAAYECVAGETALHVAVAKGDVKIVDALLAAGANINAAASRDGVTGETALHIATDEDVVKSLLRVGGAQLGNAVRQTQGGGQAASEVALVISVKAKRWNVARLLLEAGAKVTALAADPVGMEAIVENLELVKLMVSKGSTVRIYGHCVCVAVEKGLTPVVEALLGAGVDAKDYAAAGGYLEVALHLAIGKKNFAAVDRLLRAGADPNGVPKYKLGGTLASAHFPDPPLYAAVTGGDVAIVTRLVQARADPNAVGGQSAKEPVIVMAVRKGNLETVKCLVEAGANVLTTSNEYWAYNAYNKPIDPKIQELARGQPEVLKYLHTKLGRVYYC
eukprot:jgi/Mesvir1/8783/Mv02693-RA.1